MDTVEKCLQTVLFNTKDFMVKRGPTRPTKYGSEISSIQDIRDILDIYVNEMVGDNPRKKSSDRKVHNIEQSLTKSGMKKLSDCRKTIRLHLKELEKSNSRKHPDMDMNILIHENLKTGGLKDIGGDSDKSDNTDNDICKFIESMHEWGEKDSNDRRYYLHMIFRYYLHDYHTSAVNHGLVKEFPSYQYILDATNPNGCATRFPSEFRNFLEDSAGRSFNVKTVPVPKKGSGTGVNYDINFESLPEVSYLRKRIYGHFIEWKKKMTETGIPHVYPEYLHCKKREIPHVLLDAISKSETVTLLRNNIYRVENVNSENMGLVLKERPDMETLYTKYTTHVFRTKGEQLNERFGFFMRSRVRKIYESVKNHGVIDDLFDTDEFGTDMFVPFDNFCTPGRQLVEIERNENTRRSLLMTLVDTSFLFYIFHNKELSEEDPIKIVKDSMVKLNKLK